MTVFGSIKELFHSITTSDHYASYRGDRPRGHDAVPLRTGSSSELYAHGNRSAQLNSAPQAPADIPMAPIGPSVKVAWGRILEWLDEHYPELHDQVLDGATRRDISEIENDLDIALPDDVKESMSYHDGQERGGRPVGLIFGIELLDLESVIEEWSIWRRAAIRVNETERIRGNNGPSSSTSAPRYGSLPKQRSVPADAVRCVYAHPAWVPLAKDGGGNNIAIDLAPGPQGRSGQVILYGRDFDTKYVVAPSWSHFLDMFANDIQKGHPYVDDNIDDPIFAIRENRRIVSYLDLLRRRVAPPSSRTRSPAASPPPSVTISPAPVIKLEPKSTSLEAEAPKNNTQAPEVGKKTESSLLEESLATVSLDDNKEPIPSPAQEQVKPSEAQPKTEAPPEVAPEVAPEVDAAVEAEADAYAEATPEATEANDASAQTKPKAKKKNKKKKN